MILNHKKQKLVYRNYSVCNYCDIYYLQRDIEDEIRHLKEEKI